jgi:hypothetical protein
MLSSESAPTLVFLAGIVLVVAFLAIRNWERALFGTFVLIVFEGALRKWVLPSAGSQIYFLKDGILVVVYVGFLLDSRRRGFAPPEMVALKLIIMLALAFGLLEVWNPNSPSILVGLLGLKAYFLYVPIAFILPYAFESREQFLRLIRLYLILAIPVAILGFVQVRAGSGSALNQYLSHSEDAPGKVAHFGHSVDVVRTAGTFSYISGYTTYLCFIALLAIGYNMSRQWRLKDNIAPMIALVLVIGAMFTTGSRGPVFTLIAAGPIILWLALKGGLLAPRTALRLFVLLPIIGLAALAISPAAFQAFSERASEADSSYVLSRAFPVFQTIDAVVNAPILGMGIGTAQNWVVVAMGADSPWWLGDLLYEDEWARIIVELGVIGFVLLFTLRSLIVFWSFRFATSFKDPAYRALGIVLAIHLVLGLVASTVTNVTANFYYWAAVGLVFAMRRLEQTDQIEARAMRTLNSQTDQIEARAMRTLNSRNRSARVVQVR